MFLGWPLAMAGLLALAIPLAIHLLQRGVHRRVEVATTQFLVEQQRLRWRKLALDEAFLLLSRSVLVLLCVMLLAEPFRPAPSPLSGPPGWTLVSPRVPAGVAAERVTAEDDARWLSEGFPSLDQPPPVWHQGELWGLLDDADRLSPPGAPLRVIAPADAVGLGPRRIALTRQVDWIVAAGTATDGPAEAAFPGSVDIVFDPARQADAERLQTVVGAWAQAGMRATSRLLRYGPDIRPGGRTLWLSRQPPPMPPEQAGVILTDTLAPPGTAVALRFGADSAPEWLAWQRAQTRVHYYTRGLSIENPALDDPEFARQLLLVLGGEDMTRATQGYPVSPSDLAPRIDPLDGSGQPRRHSLAPALVVLILVMATLERILSAAARGRRRDR